MHFCNKQWKAVYNVNEHSMHRLIGHFIFQEDALSVYRVYIWLVTAMRRFQYFHDGGQRIPHVDLFHVGFWSTTTEKYKFAENVMESDKSRGSREDEASKKKICLDGRQRAKFTWWKMPRLKKNQRRD